MLRFYKSFKFAFAGFICLLKTERNFRIMGYCCLVTLVIGFGLAYFGEHLKRFEWAFLWLAMGLVFVSEALNTAFEASLDVLHPEQHPLIGRAKDMAAAGSLIASTIALIVGAYIFTPHIISIIQGN
ncbi:MAG: diacylglycerol kinase [Flavobacteriales bacterium]|nr:MAG: diacylglycerol kinase [Flavobacteriales bacterium]